MFQGVNLLAVLVAGAAYFILGGLWYSPLLFAKAWMAGMNIDPNDPKIHSAEGKAKAKRAMLIQGLLGLITAFVLGRVLFLAGIVELRWALHASLGLWLGFVFTAGMQQVLFEDKPWKVFFINQGYAVAGYLLMATILTVWK